MTNVAVIGCGHWGPNHIRNFAALQDARVVAAVDADPARLDAVSHMYPGINLFQDYSSVLQDPRIDAVVVATPTSTHYQVVRAALVSGKHVLCEKPLCETSEEGRELVDLAGTRSLVLMVGHVFLFNAGIQKLKELIDAEELGKVNYLSAVRTNLGPIRSDVNAAYDLAAHDVAIFNWLLGGQPELVSATGGCFVQPGIHDVAFISLRYPKNVVASVEVSWLNPKKVRQISIVGSRKMVTWDDLDLSAPVAIYDKGASSIPDYRDYGEFLRVSMWDGDVRLPKVVLEEPVKAQDRYFLEAVRKGAADCSDGAFSLGVVRVLEAVAQSLDRAGAPVEVRV